ncbi:MAG: alpha/beta hydrolase [Candidatus Tectomicrobia bacterium]|uniref:Alpha/beta hydrolase n=1 Tax=Tectimicrobiota bacterium TaxID=2528274 RepID=A0A938B0M1_UNCTE|nr:alpha/beta hydrolase [Candidatus Tectomicrobia bacterium]
MLHRWLNALILLPDRYCYQTPEDLGLHAEAVALPNAAGHLLRGFWFRPLGDNTAPTVLFCPGTSGNLSSHLYYVELLCRAGYTVLSVDYTGFGQSAGRASLHTLVSDMLCASDFLLQHKQITSLGIFGVSLGANLALQVAAQRPAIRAVAVEGLALYGEITRGVLTEGVMGPRVVTSVTYDDRVPVARRQHILNRHRVNRRLAALLAWIGMRCFPFVAKDPRIPARQLANTPVLCIHGIDDPLLPFEGTMQVYDVLPGPKYLWLIPDVGHPQEAALAQDGEYVAQLQHFFHHALQGQPSVTAPSLHAQLVPQGPQKYTLHLRNDGPSGLALATVISDHAIVCKTVWLQQDAAFPVYATGRQPAVHCQRLLAVEGEGHTTRPHDTLRGQRYRLVFRPLVRALSQLLHERRFTELEDLLQRLPHERPEPPFDFLLGVYCVQIMQRTRQRLPHIAQAAAKVFRRYWHYGPSTVSAGPPTLYTLAADVLGQQEQPSQGIPAGHS